MATGPLISSFLCVHLEKSLYNYDDSIVSHHQMPNGRIYYIVSTKLSIDSFTYWFYVSYMLTLDSQLYKAFCIVYHVENMNQNTVFQVQGFALLVM